MENDNKRVIIFDTTLRDGEQSPGASMNTAEKLRLAVQLEKLGVDVMEAGFPAASDGEFGDGGDQPIGHLGIAEDDLDGAARGNHDNGQVANPRSGTHNDGRQASFDHWAVTCNIGPPNRGQHLLFAFQSGVDCDRHDQPHICVVTAV